VVPRSHHKVKASDPSRTSDAFASHRALTEVVSSALAQARPRPGESVACPYLPGRRARRVSVRVPPSAGLYHAFMDLNFRRFGPLFYRPECEGCSECRALRVRVPEFSASRSQRRCLVRNRDVKVHVGLPEATKEKHDLYRRYLLARHDGQMDGSASEFQELLDESCVHTVEFVYRLGERVVAVGIVDREPLAWSAVYCYYDPSLLERSLGVFNILTLIDRCREGGVPHLYLGYYVRGCRTMSYKARYRPCEVLGDSGHFVPLADGRLTS